MFLGMRELFIVLIISVIWLILLPLWCGPWSRCTGFASGRMPSGSGSTPSRGLSGGRELTEAQSLIPNR